MKKMRVTYSYQIEIMFVGRVITAQTEELVKNAMLWIVICKMSDKPLAASDSVICASIPFVSDSERLISRQTVHKTTFVQLVGYTRRYK